MSEVEFLALKGIKKTHQLNRRINLTIGELVEFLYEYSEFYNKSDNQQVEEESIKYLRS